MADHPKASRKRRSSCKKPYATATVTAFPPVHSFSIADLILIVSKMEDPLALVDTDSSLQPLLDAAKESLSSVPTVRAMVVKVLSHPDIFCGYDQLKALLVNGNIEDGPLLATLDLFSYGTYASYSQNSSAYIPLNDKQIAKLRQLTLISCVQDACERGQSAISYASISEALQLSEQRQMEQVIVSCLYNRAINGKLCQKSKQLLISNVPPCVSRDVPLTSIPNMMQQLQAFQDRLSTSHAGLEEIHSDISQSLAQSAAYWKMIEERQTKAQAQQLHNNPGGSSGGGGGTVRLAGWPESSVGARRSSANRQSKRSRGGLGGPFTDPFQRY